MNDVLRDGKQGWAQGVKSACVQPGPGAVSYCHVSQQVSHVRLASHRADVKAIRAYENLLFNLILI